MSTPIETLVKNFDEFTAELSATLDQQKAELKEYGETTEKTGARIDELGNTLLEIGEELKAAQTRMDELEKAAQRPGYGEEREAKTLGERFVKSAEYKSMSGTNYERSDRFSVGGFFGKDLTSDATSGGALIVPHRVAGVVAPPERAMRLRNLLSVAPTDTNAIEYVEETGYTHYSGDNEAPGPGAKPVAEGAVKPKSNLKFARKSVNVQTIAHWIPATRQVIADASQLRSYVDARLLYGLMLEEEQQVLYGDGNSPNLQGILTHTGIQTYNWSDGAAGDTQVDAIRRGITKARVAEYPVDGIVMHPNDWEDIELLKGSDDHYIWVQVPVGGVMQLWRVPVVETTAIQPGDVALGAWSLGATLWDREEGNIRVGEPDDFFYRNQVAILAEERVALSIFRPEAFVKVSLDAAPEGGSGGGVEG